MSGPKVKTFKTRVRKPHCQCYGEVTMQRLKADAERGVAYFYSKRPWLERPVPAYGQSKRLRRVQLDLDTAVRVAVAIGEPMRGALKGIAETNGLDYAAFMKAYHKAKRVAVRRDL
jgi:hypothetical protein